MTREGDILKKGKCKNKHCSPILNFTWVHLNKKKMRFHDYCSNPKCEFPKKITFTRNQIHSEGASIKNTMKKIFKSTETSLNNFLKPAVIMAAPFIGMPAGAKSKKQKVRQAITNF